MKTSKFLFFLVMLLLTHESFSQTSETPKKSAPTVWEPYISVGYWNAPSHLNGYYAALLDHYRAIGIPIEAQTTFAKTLCIDGGFVVSRLTTIQVGLSFGFRYTPASASYSDNIGSLKIDGSLNAFDFALVVKARVAQFGDLPLFFTLEPGVSYTNAEIDDQIRYSLLAVYPTTLAWNAGDWGVRIRSTLGTAIPVGPLSLGLQVGYQVNFTSVTDANADRRWPISHSDETGLDQDAVIFLVRVGYFL